MHKNQQVYNAWATQYDSNRNRTRDLEAAALRQTLASVPFSSVLEIGCGTGKNTVWFAECAQRVVAVDFSEGMLSVAREKVAAPNVLFHQADVTKPWTFTDEVFDVVVFSLVLEHIEDLGFVFSQARQRLAPGGKLYLGELHPFKQYSGTVARFDSADGRVEAQCFVHHISDFVCQAHDSGLQIRDVIEWFDEDGDAAPPRLLTLLFDAV
jgi:ubiquinone/menaquinone biosynthesis C-methylase UbiE